MKYRRLLSLISLMIVTSCAWSQLPPGPLKLVVGYPAGGTADAVARLLADKLKTELDRSIIIENRAGAGGQIAAEFVKGSRSLGTTTLMLWSGLACSCRPRRQRVPLMHGKLHWREYCQCLQ